MKPNIRILDATCGPKTIWYQKNHPGVVFLDKRRENINTLQNGNSLRTRRTIRIQPDFVGDFTCLPFKDNVFDVVVFDPPHIIRKQKVTMGIMEMKYGCLYEAEYKKVLTQGCRELFRVLKDNGVLVFKWCETYRSLSDVLSLFPYRPLFGTRTGQRNNTHWVFFIKQRLEQDICELIGGGS